MVINAATKSYLSKVLSEERPSSALGADLSFFLGL